LSLILPVLALRMISTLSLTLIRMSSRMFLMKMKMEIQLLTLKEISLMIFTYLLMLSRLFTRAVKKMLKKIKIVRTRLIDLMIKINQTRVQSMMMIRAKRVNR